MEVQYLVCPPAFLIKNLPGRQTYQPMNNLVFKACIPPNVYLIEQMGRRTALTILQLCLYACEVSVRMMQIRETNITTQLLLPHSFLKSFNSVQAPEKYSQGAASAGEATV